MICINKRACGKEYEQIAADYLKANGYEILERNFYSRYGEIDIIAQENNVLVFVEVKYRKNSSYGYPEESVNVYKQKRIIRSAKYYIYKMGIPEECPCRFDIVIVNGNNISCIKDAFWLN